MLRETLLTLWDLIKAPSRPEAARRPVAPPAAVETKPRAPKKVAKQKPATRAVVAETQPAKCAAKAPSAKPAKNRGAAAPAEGSAQERYDQVVAMMLQKYGVRVRKWRKSMSGVAWCVQYRDGTINRLIESPKPKGPMSVAIFLHEIGHHAIGFNVYKPRCLEEYHAWAFSLRMMEELGLNITDAVHDRMYRSLHYAIGKASRRGIKRLPDELLPYVKAPPPRRRRAA